MEIRVLGSGAGGGFPQWNCNCRNCNGVRNQTIKATPRTQSSIVVSSDGEHWVLFNASPDIRAQIESCPGIQPHHGVRDTGISAVVLCDGQIDHTTGLLILRESPKPLDIYCTSMVRDDLQSGFPIFNMLGHFCGVNHHEIPFDGRAFTIPGIDDLRFYPHALKSKAPPYSPHRENPHAGDNIGIIVEQISTGKTLYYSPGLGEIEPQVNAAMTNADCVLVDGTFWTDTEMIDAGVSHKTARSIGHLPQSGAGGMIEVMDALDKPRKVLIHINNTNPILDEESEQRKILGEHGIEVAYDGLEINI